MSTLFLAWQDTNSSRLWYPIGKLEAESGQGPFRFTYTKGAEKAHAQSKMPPLESFPDFHATYESDVLFPLFQNRLLQSGRADFAEYLRVLDLDTTNPDPLEILALTEGKRQTDNLEVFPKITRSNDGSFRCRFFVHGWRHVGDAGRSRIETLKPGDPLRVAIELNNPATGLAVQLQASEYQIIGWTPRYLVIDLMQIINNSYQNIRAKVVRVNHDFPASMQQRVLVELSGIYPYEFEPMSSEEFQTIAPSFKDKGLDT